MLMFMYGMCVFNIVLIFIFLFSPRGTLQTETLLLPFLFYSVVNIPEAVTAFILCTNKLTRYKNQCDD